MYGSMAASFGHGVSIKADQSKFLGHMATTPGVHRALDKL